MKKLIFILSCLVLLSCNNTSGNNAAMSKSDAASASTTSGAGKGIITCTMDGKSRTFQVLNGFTEINLDAYSKGPNDGLMLLDGSATNEGFQFEIKNKGTSNFAGVEGTSYMLSYFNGKGADYVEYENVTASVTSFNGTHLTGNFSGKFQNTNYKNGSDGNPEFIQITDGRFDLDK